MWIAFFPDCSNVTRTTVRSLEGCGFVNKVLPVEKEQDQLFTQNVLEEVNEWLEDHLIGDSMLAIKQLMRRPDVDSMELQNMAEALGAMDCHLTGVPQEQFRKIANGQKRHFEASLKSTVTTESFNT